MRRTKIIATVGPAINSEPALRELVAAGVDVFRLNFSHGTHDTHGRAISTIRGIADEAGRSVAILQDLCGPKIRTGLLRDRTPITLKDGEELTIAVGDFPGEPGRVSTTYEHLPGLVTRGDTLLLDDGRIQLRVEASDGREIRTIVVDGGQLGERKGINAPGVRFPASGLTAKDRDDLAFGVRSGVDYVAMSFVMSASDLHQARAALRDAGAPDLPLVAKLERPEAIASLDEVLHACQAVMVARGDLGLEMPLETVPRVQKAIVRRARELGVPVIVATQVFESMIVEPRPTRAEVSDAANAVADGADAVMFSGETAVGSHPTKAIQTLDRVLRDAEKMPVTKLPLEEAHVRAAHGQAICEAALTLAERGKAAAIIAITRGGKTAELLSALRPSTPIIGATDQPEVFRRLALSWGVLPLLTSLADDVAVNARHVGAMLASSGVIPSGSPIVLVSITPDLGPGPTNFVTLRRV